MKYFKNIIFPDLIKRKIIKKGETPTYLNLRENNHIGFLSAIRYRGIGYNDILKANNLKIHHDMKKYEFLRKDDEGNSLNYDQKMNIAVKFFLKTIIPDLINKKIINKNETPTQLHLDLLGYRSFINALSKGKNSITFNELLDYTGYAINCDPNKWNFLDHDKKENVLTRRQQHVEASNYLKNIIVPDLIKKNKIKKGQAPTRAQLQRYGHNDFLNAFSNREMLYDDIVSLSGLKLTRTATLTRIGIFIHWIIEYFFLRHTRSKNTKSYYEISPSSSYDLYKLRRCDNSIIIDKHFKKLSKLTEEFSFLHPCIKMINIDYHFGESLSDIRDKCYRGYQSYNKFLIIVSLMAKDTLTAPISIPYRNNVQVLDLKTFTTFFGFKEDDYLELTDLRTLAISAITSKSYLKILRILSKKAKLEIIKGLNYSQKELEKFLKSKNLLNLLDYSKDKMFISNWL